MAPVDDPSVSFEAVLGLLSTAIGDETAARLRKRSIRVRLVLGIAVAMLVSKFVLGSDGVRGVLFGGVSGVASTVFFSPMTFLRGSHLVESSLFSNREYAIADLRRIDRTWNSITFRFVAHDGRRLGSVVVPKIPELEEHFRGSKRLTVVPLGSTFA